MTQLHDNEILEKLSNQELQKIISKEKEQTFTSNEVDDIFFVKDILNNNGKKIDDLDVILKIINQIKSWKSIL